LDNLVGSILSLDQFAEIRTEFAEPTRAILAESYADGQRTPVESGLNEERCNFLRKASADEIAGALPGLQSAIDFAEGRAATPD
jgi:hypothetical protein